jgi:TPR repeat protein
MSTSLTGPASKANIASTSVQPTTKTESTSQGRVVSKVPDSTCPNWLKKALLVAAVVASVFALAFTLAVTAGLSGVTVLGLSGLAKSITAVMTTGGTCAVLGFSYLGSLLGLSYAVLGLYNLSKQSTQIEQSKIEGEKALKQEKAVNKEETELRKKMANGKAIEALLAEKKPSPMMIQVFFEFISQDKLETYCVGVRSGYGFEPEDIQRTRNEERQSKLLNLFSKSSLIPEEKAAWSILNIWINVSDRFDSKDPTQPLSEAAIILKKTADEGSPLANFLLALCYAEGRSFPKNTDKAITHCKFAADKGFAMAIFLLADLKMQKLHESKKPNDQPNRDDKPKEIPKEIFDLIILAAEKGLPMAQLTLGELYKKGEILEKNPALSKQYYQLAADQNNSEAIYKLAKGYLEGIEGFDKDEEKGLNLLKQAAALGNEDAERQIRRRIEIAERAEENRFRQKMNKGPGVLIETLLAETRPLNPKAIQVFFEFDVYESIRRYKEKLKATPEQATQNLNHLFSKTSTLASERAAWAAFLLWQNDSVATTERQDPSEAIQMLTEAAETGDALSNYLLGSVVEQGKIPLIDKTKNEHYKQKAHEKGLALATFELYRIEKFKQNPDFYTIEYLLAPGD